MKRSVAFEGVGRKGANMARRLRRQSFGVTALYDLHREGAAEHAAELRAATCATLAAVTALKRGAILVFRIGNFWRSPMSSRERTLNLVKGRPVGRPPAITDDRDLLIVRSCSAMVTASPWSRTARW